MCQPATTKNVKIDAERLVFLDLSAEAKASRESQHKIKLSLSVADKEWAASQGEIGQGTKRSTEVAALTHDRFVADVVAVYNGGTFGSGRLIAPGLILTAGYIVDYPTREAPKRTGWKVVLLREKRQDGAWGDPHDAKLVWRGLGSVGTGRTLV